MAVTILYCTVASLPEVSTLLTLPLCGRGSSTHCVCLCVRVSVTGLAGAISCLKAKVRYQQKTLDAGNKMNVGTELKIFSSTVISLP